MCVQERTISVCRWYCVEAVQYSRDLHCCQNPDLHDDTVRSWMTTFRYLVAE